MPAGRSGWPRTAPQPGNKKPRLARMAEIATMNLKPGGARHPH